jgi:hypothetical protein
MERPVQIGKRGDFIDDVGGVQLARSRAANGVDRDEQMTTTCFQEDIGDSREDPATEAGIHNISCPAHELIKNGPFEATSQTQLLVKGDLGVHFFVVFFLSLCL